MKTLILIATCTWLTVVIPLDSVKAQTGDADPCSAQPCGIGAKCAFMRDMVVCTCSDDTFGDPFEECKKLSPDGSSATTHLENNMGGNQGTTLQTSATSVAETLGTSPTRQTTQTHMQEETPSPSQNKPNVISINEGVNRYHVANADYSNNYNPNTPIVIPTVQKPKTQESQNKPFFTSLDQTRDPHRSPTTMGSFLDSGNHRTDSISNTPKHTTTTTTMRTTTTSEPEPYYNHNKYYHSSTSSDTPHSVTSVRLSPIVPNTDATPIYNPITKYYSDDKIAVLHPITITSDSIGYQNSHSSVDHTSDKNRFNYNDYANNQHKNGYDYDNSHKTTYNSGNDDFNFHKNGNTQNQHHHQQSNFQTKDPMGEFTNCRIVNNIVACADNSGDDFSNNFQHRTQQTGDNEDNSFQHRFQHHSYEKPRPGHHDSIKHTNFPNFASQHNDYQTIRTPIHSSEGSSQAEYKLKPTHQSPVDKSDTNDLCKKLCGVNSVCRLFLGRPVCGCPAGHSGDPSVMCTKIEPEKKSGCQRHTDCKAVEICMQSVCVNPCVLAIKNPSQNPIKERIDSHSVNVDSSMCGNNAKCLVIQHTPLCACNDGFFGNPYVACTA